jgi:hypothetical protein
LGEQISQQARPWHTIALISDTCHGFLMSAAEIIAELPKLTRDERAAVARRLRELEEEDVTAFLHEVAFQTFQNIDKLEDEDAHRKT